MQPDSGRDDSPWIVSTGEQAPDVVAALLRTVPEWFGIEESNTGYVESARHLPTYLARPRVPEELTAGASQEPVGVLLATRHFPGAAEIHLMAVARSAHRRGVGRAPADRRGARPGRRRRHPAPGQDLRPVLRGRRLRQDQAVLPGHGLRAARGTRGSVARDPEATGEFEWFGWQNPWQYRRLWQENGLLSDDSSVLMVHGAGEVAGLVSWRRRLTGRTSFCWSMGVALLPEARGQGYGTQAQRELVRYLFLHTLANRVEATTEIGNLAEQRVLEKVGFIREGVMRGGAFQGGRWRDAVLYSILRAEVDL